VTSFHISRTFIFVYLQEVRPADIESVDKRQRDDVGQTCRVTAGAGLDVTADERQDVSVDWVSVAQRRDQLIM